MGKRAKKPHRATKTGKGSSGQTVIVSPAWVSRQKKRRRAEEAEWASKNGPVQVRRIEEGESSA